MTSTFKVSGTPPKKRIKNCYNCKHIDYYEPYYESHDSGGYSCNNREYKNEVDETRHLEKLNTKPKYLDRPKKCCELRR